MTSNLWSNGQNKKQVFSSQCDSRMLWMKIKLHIMVLLWTCGALTFSSIVLFQKNFTSMIRAWKTVISLEGGNGTVLGTITYCERRPDFLSVPLTKPRLRAPHPPQHHAWSLNNFSALSRWHLVAYFLSYPFISCHFSEASQVAAAKRNGRWLE